MDHMDGMSRKLRRASGKYHPHPRKVTRAERREEARRRASAPTRRMVRTPEALSGETTRTIRAAMECDERRLGIFSRIWGFIVRLFARR